MSSEVWNSLGVVYEGGYDKRGKISGPGKLIYKNGIVIEGNFSNEQLNGEAVVILPDQSRYKSVFKNGIEVPGTASYTWDDGLTMTLSALSEEDASTQSNNVEADSLEDNSSNPSAAGAPDAQHEDSSDDRARKEWLYLHPHDRRLWDEHKEGLRANIYIEAANKKSQTDIVLGPY